MNSISNFNSISDFCCRKVETNWMIRFLHVKFKLKKNCWSMEVIYFFFFWIFQILVNIFSVLKCSNSLPCCLPADLFTLNSQIPKEFLTIISGSFSPNHPSKYLNNISIILFFFKNEKEFSKMKAKGKILHFKLNFNLNQWSRYVIGFVWFIGKKLFLIKFVTLTENFHSKM